MKIKTLYAAKKDIKKSLYAILNLKYLYRHNIMLPVPY